MWKHITFVYKWRSYFMQCKWVVQCIAIRLLLLLNGVRISQTRKTYASRMYSGCMENQLLDTKLEDLKLDTDKEILEGNLIQIKSIRYTSDDYKWIWMLMFMGFMVELLGDINRQIIWMSVWNYFNWYIDVMVSFVFDLTE